MVWFFLGLTALGLPALLIGERSGTLVRAVAKPVASTGFVGLAVGLGAPDTVYGRWILAGLVLGWIGDVALLGRSRPSFLTGLGAFLAGHLAYVVAFAVLGVLPVAVMAATPPAFGLGTLVHRWLRPHIPPSMTAPVVAYVVVISAMVVCALGVIWGGAATWLIPVGAAAFYLSDLSVARDRFVAPGFVNRLWGLPAYYLAQVLLAWSVTT